MAGVILEHRGHSGSLDGFFWVAVSGMRKAAKRDANEKPIIEALKARGCGVTQLSQKGVPDLLCSFNDRFFLVEVKSKGGKLTEDQLEFMSLHAAWVHIARSVEDVPLILKSI